MEVLTTQPGMQFYTGNHIHGEIHGKGGVVYGARGGFCCENSASRMRRTSRSFRRPR